MKAKNNLNHIVLKVIFILLLLRFPLDCSKSKSSLSVQLTYYSRVMYLCDFIYFIQHLYEPYGNSRVTKRDVTQILASMAK